MSYFLTFFGLSASLSLEVYAVDLEEDLSGVALLGTMVAREEGGARGRCVIEAGNCTDDEFGCLRFPVDLEVFLPRGPGEDLLSCSGCSSGDSGIMAGSSRCMRGEGAAGLMPWELMLRLSASSCCCASRFVSRIKVVILSRLLRSCSN